MKNVLFVAFVAFAWLGCQNPTTTNEPTETAPAPPTVPSNAATNPEKMCFRLLEGTKSQDTTHLELTIIGTEVSGKMDWVPHEKDSARGTITGKINGNVITGIYNYMIEGSQQSEEVAFQMGKGQIMRKRGELTETAPGQLVFKDVEKARFTDVFTQIPCP